MRVGGDVGNTLTLQQLGIGARRRYGQVTYLGDGGTHRTLIGRAVAEDDVVGDDTPLLVRRTCQWDHGLLAGYEVIDLDRVAQGVDILVGGSQVVINRDATQLADGQSGLFRQLGLGPYANTQDHHIDRDLLATVQVDGHVTLVVLEFGHAILEDQMQSLLCEVLVYDRRHRVIEWGHHLVGHLYDRGLDAQLVQVFRHLKTDKTATDNDRRLWFMTVDISFDLVRIGHVAEREDPLVLNAGDAGAEWLGSGREYQLVVRFQVGLAIGQVLDLYLLLVRDEASDLLPCPDVDAEPAREAVDSLYEQLVALLDCIAYIIR